MDFLCEHVVERKKKGLYKLKHPCIIMAWIVLPTIFIIVCMALSTISLELLFLRWSFFLIPLFVFLAVKIGPISAAYGLESYEYSIMSGEMKFSKIFGDRFRREWFSLSLPKAEKIAPYLEEYNSEADNGSFKHVYKAVSSMDAPYIYYCIFVNEHNERCIVFFEVIKKSMRMIKTYAPNTVVINLPF